MRRNNAHARFIAEYRKRVRELGAALHKIARPADLAVLGQRAGYEVRELGAAVAVRWNAKAGIDCR